MKKLLALILLFLPIAVFAQTYPSPTFNTLTLQNPLTPANGGTGVSNGSTITLAGPLVTTGANSLTLATTGTTSVTLPTSGTLLTSAGAAGTYAPIASPTFTGTVTIPSGASITGYLTTTSAASTYAPLTSPTFTGSVTIPGGSINGTSVGATTTSTGAFTALSSTGNFTPSQTNGIVGTTTNNNANAGSVGEYVSSIVASGSAVPLTSTVAATVTSISLTAGDWQLSGLVAYSTSGATGTAFTGGISTSSSSITNNNGYFIDAFASSGLQANAFSLNSIRLSLSSTTTVFLLAQANFTAGTVSAYGFIGARRVR